VENVYIISQQIYSENYARNFIKIARVLYSTVCNLQLTCSKQSCSIRSLCLSEYVRSHLYFAGVFLET